MNQFKLLKPEEAARRAKENVAAFKKEQERKAAEAKLAEKRKPTEKPEPAVETEKAEPSKKDKNKLNRLLLENAEKGNRGEVKRLLKAGADVNAQDRQGSTALMLAAKCRQEEVAELLIAKGANVNAMSKDGRTALSEADNHGWGSRKIVHLLMDRGARR